MSSSNNNFNKELNLLAKEVNINAALGEHNLKNSNKNNAANNKSPNTIDYAEQLLNTSYDPTTNYSLQTWFQSNESSRSDVLPGLNYKTLMSKSQHSTLPDNIAALEVSIINLTNAIHNLYYHRYNYTIPVYTHYKNIYIQNYNYLINDFIIITDKNKDRLTPALNNLHYHLRLMKSFSTTSYNTGRHVPIATGALKNNSKTHFKPIKRNRPNKNNTRKNNTRKKKPKGKKK